MRFKVIKPFRLDGLVRMPGQMVEMDVGEASRFRAMGLIGRTEQAVAPPAERTIPPGPERAVKPPGEHRTYRPRKRKVEDETHTDNAADD